MKNKQFFLLILILSAILLFGEISQPVCAQLSSFGPAQTGGDYRVETYSNGDRYEGYFVNGLYNGEGTYIWANGDRYPAG